MPLFEDPHDSEVSTLHVAISEARGQFKRMLQQVHLHRKRVVLTHYAEPVAALIPLADLQHLEPTALTSTPRRTSRELRDHLREAWQDLAVQGQRTLVMHYTQPVAGLVPPTDLNRLLARPPGLVAGPTTGGPMRRTTIITFFSHAGGVGKTSSCRDIGYELSQLGHKVLLIDLDPQANLTDWLGVDPEDIGTETLFDALIDSAPLPPVQEVHGMHLYPSGLELAELEGRLPAMPMGGSDRLKKVLQPVVDTGTYDFILIDTPPTLGKPVLISLYASNEVIIPVSSRNKGLKAVRTVHEMVNTYREYNPGLNILSHLITQRGTTNHSRAAEEVAEASLPHLSGPIKTRPAIYDECQVAKQPVGVFAPNSEARAEVQLAVKQILGYMAVSA